MRVCLGGTFDTLHVGHVELLAKAFEVGDEVFIGLTGQKMAQAHRQRRVKPFSVRLRNLEALLRKHQWNGVVSEITSPEGRALEPRYDAIVVSPETLHRVVGINRERRKRGLKLLKVFTIPFLYGDDGLRISATRIAKKEIGPEGHRRTPVRVAVGTANRVKRDAVLAAFRKAFPKLRFQVRAFDVRPGVPAQPVGRQTGMGAIRRAERALHSWRDADYAVGIEAGLVDDVTARRHLDMQYVVIDDKEGGRSVSHGGGFYYPQDVEKKVLHGKTVSAVLGPIAGDPRLGSTTGAVGFLSNGAMDRRELTEHAVLLALVPRIRRDLYQE